MNALSTLDFDETDLPLPTLDGAEQHRRLHRMLKPGDLPLLRRIAGRLAKGSVDPDDLLQDALERACRNVHRFEPDSSAIAWIRTIMQRLLIDQWRRQRRRAHKQVPADEVAGPMPFEDADAPLASARYDLDDVRQAVDALPEPLRTTFRLFALDGLNYAQIVLRQGVLLATVGTRLRRARLRLRRILEAQAARRATVIPLDGTAARRERSSGRASGQWCSRRRRPTDLPATTLPTPRLPTRFPAATAGPCSRI